MESNPVSRGPDSSPAALTAKAAKVLARLEAEPDPQRRRLLLSLAAILRTQTPLAYIALCRPARVAAIIGGLLRFLEVRRRPSAVHLLPGAPGRPLLLTNAPDAPFLLDAVQNHLLRRGLRYQVVAHPILSLRRRRGVLVDLEERREKGKRESFIILELEETPTPEIARELAGEIAAAIEGMLLVARHRSRLRQRLKDLEAAARLQGDQDFWQWLQQDNFLPLSYRCLEIEQGDSGTVRELPGSALGLPSEPLSLSCCRPQALADFDAASRARLQRERGVVVEGIDRPSPLHHVEPLVYIGFRRLQGEHQALEHVFLGHFTRKSTSEPAFNVPPLRRKIEAALETLLIPRGSYDYRKTMEIFNTFPKVELFFLTAAELVEIVRSFTLLYRQGAVKAVTVRSLAVQGITLLVIMPRELYDNESLARMERVLRRAFASPAVVSRIIHFSPDFLSLHIHISHPLLAKGRFPDPHRLEEGLARAIRPWGVRLRRLLERRYGHSAGERLAGRYLDGFSREYRAIIHPRFALRDVLGLEEVLAGATERFDLWGPFHREGPCYRLQFYSTRRSSLNELIPLLDNLELEVIEEVDFVVPGEAATGYIKSFVVRQPAMAAEPLATLKGRLLAILRALRLGEAENDSLNRLLVRTGLDWQELDVFRGYRNYYFQLGSPFTKSRFACALINHPRAALLLFHYFAARFEPGSDEVGVRTDRLLRTLFNLIDSTVRTNFFRRRGRPDYFFAFKISALGIIDMPAPRPLYEIYVHAAAMEGIHLRGGPVARGGIRWSERPDDFRTEILGLMKTQMSKNALIVPVGAKGGFVVKGQRGGDLAERVRPAYATLIRGLLDLTDNRVAAGVETPPALVAYDGEDPYLVVAADKGTAHFSDFANSLGAEYRFWLGDAFASGGSRGYDHKQLGITARGAWECVKRHFLELGLDIGRQPFTVVGIGDMSGDVFGNGMLLSPQIRLLAAFDHRHIFLDPDADPEIAFRERRRLFALPRSSWADYDRLCIAEGGGVYSREAKEIPLSPQVRRWLGVRQGTIDPPGLIRLLLTAPVDLLWNGGIGTYVKGSAEKDSDVGDRTNDPLRVVAAELRARVVGEGGNLGFTQKGRIEYALAGGRINTDAVDNSGGVDCSDHEVNLKIFLEQLLAAGRIAPAERDPLLAAMADEVCAAVLADSDGQGLCLSLDQRRCARDIDPFLDLAERLINAGLLDRRSESFLAAKEVLARPERRLTRPELAVLMAYGKMQIKQTLLGGGAPLGEEFGGFLRDYFPQAIRERFADALSGHPLAGEITATRLTNILVNQAGSAFVQRLKQLTGASPAQIAAAYFTFDQVLGGRAFRREVGHLGLRVAAERQYELLLVLEEALAELCHWALQSRIDLSPGAAAATAIGEQAVAFTGIAERELDEPQWHLQRQQIEALAGEGVPASLARRAVLLPLLEELLPIAAQAGACGDMALLVGAGRGLQERLEIAEIQKLFAQIQPRDRWDRLASQSLQRQLSLLLRQLTVELCREGGDLEAFLTRRRAPYQYYKGVREGLRAITPANYHPLTVLLEALAELRRDGAGEPPAD